MSNSKENPASFARAAEYFSGLSGLSTTIEKVVLKAEQLRGKGKKKRLLYRSYDITVVTADGSRFAYMQANNLRYDAAGIAADHFIVTVARHIDDFGIEYESAGTFKEDAGGGAYYKTPVYRHKDFYFAPLS